MDKNGKKSLPFIIILLSFIVSGIVLADTQSSSQSSIAPSMLSGNEEPEYFELQMSFADTPVAQAFEMLSGLAQVSIVLRPGVEGSVTANVNEISVDAAIRRVAEAAGLAVEKNGKSYTVMKSDQVGQDTVGDFLAVRSFKVQYLDTAVVAEVLGKYLSRYGNLTAIANKKRIIVADRPEFLQRIEKVLKSIDVEPRQILIEAEILEIALTDDESYGIDWTSRVDRSAYGTEGLSQVASSGFVMNYLTNDVDAVLRALSESGRVRTLSTPKLLVLEDQDAEVVIGDRIGYRVTTTIDSVTSESVEFIESGVILRVKAAVDSEERIMLDVHPEVSSGSINNGIPSLTTTEVTTQLIANDGEPIFIGGLIRNSKSEREGGVPGLRSIPVVGGLFSQTEDRFAKSETIVLIRPYLVESGGKVKRRELARSYALSQQLKQDVAKESGTLDLNNGIHRKQEITEGESYYDVVDEEPVDEAYVSQKDIAEVKSQQHYATEEKMGSNKWGWILGVLTLIVLL